MLWGLSDRTTLSTLLKELFSPMVPATDKTTAGTNLGTKIFSNNILLALSSIYFLAHLKNCED